MENNFWTDDLAKEFAEVYKGNISTYGHVPYFVKDLWVEDFKKSKEVKPDYEAGVIVLDTYTDKFYTKLSTGLWTDGSNDNFTITSNDVIKGKRFIVQVKPQPKVKFTTPTNEAIYEGEDCFYMPIETLGWINKAVKGYPQPAHSFYYFKTKADAEGFQLANKPITVSYKEMDDFLNQQHKHLRSLKDFFKQKINP